MARTVDPKRYAERREAILSAAYRQFATNGYDRTTTAAICREAGISSGTFFHYFPTKLDALVGVLLAGVETTRGELQRITAASPGLAAVLNYARVWENDIGDEHFGGFAGAVGGLPLEPSVAAALDAESSLIAQFIGHHLAAAKKQGELRDDVAVETLSTWTRWLMDGAAHSAVQGEASSGELSVAISALLSAR